MIIIIFGAPGAGKSALMTYFIKKLYIEQGRAILSSSQSRIKALNRTRRTPLTVPDRVPIYSDFKVNFKVGYEKWYEPYFINGFYFGLPNEKMPEILVAPGGKVFLSEAQRYFNSRQRGLPDYSSRLFEMHRHYGLDIYMDTQRPGLIDLNIRALCKSFIEVMGIEHEYDFAGRIVASTFRCRAFRNNADVEEYLNAGAGNYTETTYEIGRAHV